MDDILPPPDQAVEPSSPLQQQKHTVRPIRNDLRLMEGARYQGGPTWTINDLSANRFFNLGWQEFEILSRWHMGDADDIVADITASTTLRPTVQDVLQLLSFLRANNLLIPQGAEEREILKQAYLKKKHIGLSTLIKGYLFFKIPFWRPDRFLDIIAPRLDFVFTKTALIIVAALTILSLLLVAGQWTSFRHTFIYFFTFEGIVISVISLSISQVTHELGHAIVAKRLGLKVPVMGVAFLVMFPIVYTDTTDAWKLKSRREKMAINIAGVSMDIMMAVVATLLWFVLPDGALRSACFIMASVTWVMTLAVNLNPLMRFDGYYLLSDGLRIQNMQARSFEYAKWFLRRHIFGLSTVPPERPPLWQHYFMLGYSYATWVYRFFLFLGIALAVYHLFFKALGIVMMMVEVIYFVTLPIVRELRVWWKQRKDITMNRISQTSLALFVLLLLVLFIPWQSHIEAPALLKSRMETTLYAPLPSQIEKVLVHNGDMVKKGDILFVLRADKLDYDKKSAELDAEQYRTMMTRGAVSGDWRDQRLVSSRNLQASEASLAGIQEQKDRLDIHAPFDAQVLDIDSEMHEGRWVNVAAELGRLVTPSSRIIMAYVRERDFGKIQKGASVVFESDTPSAAITGTVSEIDPIAQKYLEEDILASDFKGGVAARRNDKGNYIPHEAVYRVQIDIKKETPNLALQSQRGWVSIKGERSSIAMNAILRARTLFVKEASLE